MSDHLQQLRDSGKVKPRRMVETRPPLLAMLWSARWILAATGAWLVAEFSGAFSREPGDTLTETQRWLMAAHPLAAWTLAAAWAALCLWLVPHFVVGLDWRWLVWLVVVLVLAALGTYGLLTAGILTTR